MSRRIVFVIILMAAAVSIILSGCKAGEEALGGSGKSQYKELASKLQEYVDNFADVTVFNASVLIAKNGEILLSKGYGMSDFKSQTENTPETVFGVGCISKQFTAAGIMLLKEKGLLDVQDALDKYIPDYPDGDKIKLYHLLTNTSGIIDCTGLLPRSQWIAPHTLEEHIELFKDQPLRFNPGDKYEESNSNFILLGYIIEKVSGIKFEEYMKKNIFEPLGMQSSGFNLNASSVERAATGYDTIKPELVEALKFDFSTFHAAAGLQTTTEDLYKWDRALHSEGFLKKESLKEMCTPNLNRYGYGIVIGADYVEHLGLVPGFIGFMRHNTPKDYTIIILSNSRSDNSRMILAEVKKILEQE